MGTQPRILEPQANESAQISNFHQMPQHHTHAAHQNPQPPNPTSSSTPYTQRKRQAWPGSNATHPQRHQQPTPHEPRVPAASTRYSTRRKSAQQAARPQRSISTFPKPPIQHRRTPAKLPSPADRPLRKAR
ncbi:uncharacterized protein K452DRAFT_153542 [Aplosporella prunicola CBS 121167]|uniref:Uncharacterized protein n=1 Tax=Aplosporella prunicola CBS 121167 TaxID=1176127 RepID=A0A6A6BLI4_9PEZI|nr:uncharacterized protein K452DRAFT_153542 [Aplosporella prunicola CBS 121167]KAF2144134.1 hypothetical protein K452DRAFT_153542 [Aplosporella prunicola CBS 121167]